MNLINGDKIKLINPMWFSNNVGEVYKVIDVDDYCVLLASEDELHYGYVKYSEVDKFFEKYEETEEDEYDACECLFNEILERLDLIEERLGIEIHKDCDEVS